MVVDGEVEEGPPQRQREERDLAGVSKGLRMDWSYPVCATRPPVIYTVPGSRTTPRHSGPIGLRVLQRQKLVVEVV